MIYPFYIVELIALCTIAVELVISLFTALRNKTRRHFYDERARLSEYKPKCSVIIPTKGLPREAEEKFNSFVRQDYHRFEILFVVESKDDTGVQVIRKFVQKHEHARLIIAGLSKSCSQQNHNMITGIRASDSPDVLVFADNDISPPVNWLRRLVTPLEDEKITVTSCYRWFYGNMGTFSERSQIFMNMTMYAHYSFFSYITGYLLWGGSFAIRRRDFESLNIASRWNETVSDDLVLSGILKKNRKKALLIPAFLINADEPLETLSGALGWFTRQLLNVKAYHYLVWAFAIMPTFFLVAGFYLLLPAAWIGSSMTGTSFREWGGIAALLFYAGDMFINLIYGMIEPTRKHWLSVMCTPMLRLPQIIGAMKTIGVNSLMWAGITYRFNRQGQVNDITR